MSANKSTSKTESDNDLAFEEVIARLQRVVDALEGGELPLEQSLAMFEQGVKLSRLGHNRLDEAELRVERLLADEDEVTTEAMPEQEIGLDE